MSFSNAHNFHIENGNFQNASNIQNINQFHQRPTDPMGILDFERAPEASHKSSTAEAAPKCNPKTRKEVIGDIVDWITEPDNPKSILWLCGPAGAGKTCIMREVVAECESMPGIITASYFFSSRAPVVTERPFVATIAHQLTRSTTPGLKSSILNAVSEDPTVFRDGLNSQVEALLIKPLQAIGFRTPSTARKIVIVIDGLDECADEPERKHLVGLSLLLVRKLSPSMVVVISSRPNLDIRTVFDRPDVNTATKVLQLHTYDGTKDVRTFYCDEFEKIRTTHLLRHYIPTGWPSEATLQILIDKSSGNFIYPATIIKYITTHPRQNPVQLLKQAMSASPQPLAELDALYTLILHPPDVDFPLMKRLLYIVLRLHGECTSALLEDLFQLSAGIVDVTFCDLHSVLHIPSLDSEVKTIRFHHKSLEDFLVSPERSGDLFQSPDVSDLDIGLACIRRLQAWDQRPNIPRVPEALWRASQLWAFYILKGYNQLSLHAPNLDLILGFDPRSSWTYIFIHYDPLRGSIYIERFTKLWAKFHSVQCMDKSACLPLCKRMKVMFRCSERAEKTVKRFRDGCGTREERMARRLAALPQFKHRSGLYPELQLEEPPITVPSGVEGLVPSGDPGYGWVEENLSSDSDLDSSSDDEADSPLDEVDCSDPSGEQISSDRMEPLDVGHEHAGLPVGVAIEAEASVERVVDGGSCDESADPRRTRKGTPPDGKEPNEVGAAEKEAAGLPLGQAMIGMRAGSPAQAGGSTTADDGSKGNGQIAQPAKGQQLVVSDDRSSDRSDFLSSLRRWVLSYF